MKNLQNQLGINDNCITRCSKLHPVSENKMVFQLDTTNASNDKFWCIKVDNCMITNAEQRCDYAF